MTDYTRGLQGVLQDLKKRLAEVERIVADPIREVLGRRLKSAGAVAQGDVYVLDGSEAVATTESEGSQSQVVIALESKTDDVGDGMVWPLFAFAGVVWANYKTGETPAVDDYVITSDTAGKVVLSTESISGSFGRVLRVDSTNKRVLIVIGNSGGGGGGGADIKVWRQSATPTAQADILNVFYDTDNDHFYYWNGSSWIDWGWV